jgi:hypothetical protein
LGEDKRRKGKRRDGRGNMEGEIQKGKYVRGERDGDREKGRRKSKSRNVKIVDGERDKLDK